jgi:hypothetical protein
VRLESAEIVRLQSYRVFLLTGNLTWCLEVDAEECLIALFALADIFYCVDMEGDSETMNRQDNGRCFSINENLKAKSWRGFA